MKLFLIFSFSFLSISCFSQLQSGDLVDEGRKLAVASTFKIIGTNVGTVIYELSVNRKGMVTATKLISEGTTVSSTPTRISVRNFVMKLKFEEGTAYPEFQHVKVKITVAKT